MGRKNLPLSPDRVEALRKCYLEGLGSRRAYLATGHSPSTISRYYNIWRAEGLRQGDIQPFLYHKPKPKPAPVPTGEEIIKTEKRKTTGEEVIKAQMAEKRKARFRQLKFQSAGVMSLEESQRLIEQATVPVTKLPPGYAYGYEPMAGRVHPSYRNKV